MKIPFMKEKSVRKPILADENHCTGCSACAELCPKHCIKMEHDCDGFLFPKINFTQCDLYNKGKCGICEKKCPVLNVKTSDNFKEPECYCVKAKDEIRSKASSGGFVPVLENFLSEQNKAFVYGVVWNEDFEAIHVEESDPKLFAKFRGSKYVQSNTSGVYSRVKNRLKENKNVLFVGTPCQIAGLKAYLGNTDISKLITVDLVCHGVSSSKVLRKFLNDNEIKISDVDDIKFRDKKTSWYPSLAISFKDQSSKNFGLQNSFMKGFNPCLLQRKSCGTCPYACVPRQGDFSCGDFWGVNKFHPDFDNRGTSFVLVNSNRAKIYFDLLRGIFEYCELENSAHITEINKTILRPFHTHPGRKHFFSSLNLKTFNELVDNSLVHKYDVGIVGLWFGINYGSILTYYALYVFLRNNGYDAVFLPRPNNLFRQVAKHFDDSNSIAMKFIWSHCNVFINTKRQEDFVFFNRNCDCFVVGSDVVWNYNVVGRANQYCYYLDWAFSNKKKIAYASSCGDLNLGQDKYFAKAAELLKRFDAISVREKNLIELIEKKTGIENVVNAIDPVFLIDKQNYLALFDSSNDNKNALFVYILRLDQGELKKKIIDFVIQDNSIAYVDYNFNPWDPKDELIKEYGVLNYKEKSVEEWLSSLYSSKYYVGDSYHGLCFALIFHIPFLMVFDKKNTTIERIRDLLDFLSLSDRLILEESDLNKINLIIKRDIDWDAIDKKLSEKIIYSKDWFLTHLKEEKIYDVEFNLLEERYLNLYQESVHRE